MWYKIWIKVGEKSNDLEKVLIGHDIIKHIGRPQTLCFFKILCWCVCFLWLAMPGDITYFAFDGCYSLSLLFGSH